MKYEDKIFLRTQIIFAVHSSGNNSGFPVTSKIRRDVWKPLYSRKGTIWHATLRLKNWYLSQ
jgi:hypothetical protein